MIGFIIYFNNYMKLKKNMLEKGYRKKQINKEHKRKLELSEMFIIITLFTPIIGDAISLIFNKYLKSNTEMFFKDCGYEQV